MESSADMSFRDLWHFVSGTTVLWHEDLVLSELNRNWKMISSGLNYFRPYGSSKQASEKKPESMQHQLVAKLARELNLDESQTYDMYRLYLLREFRGSRNTLRIMFSSELQKSALMDSVKQFYMSERLYLLRCLKHVLAFSSGSNHPYESQYNSVVSLPSNAFFDEVWKQVMKCKESIVELISNAQFRDRDVASKILQLMKEYRELLTIMLLCSLLAPAPVSLLLAMVTEKKTFQLRLLLQRVGLVDDSTDALVTLIGNLQMLYIVYGLRLEEVIHLEGSEVQALFGSDQMKKLGSLIDSLEKTPCESALLLSWSVVVCKSASTHTVSHSKIEKLIMQLGTFEYLHSMLSSDAFSKNTELCSVSRVIVYTLLSSLCSLYDEVSLCNIPCIFDVAADVVLSPELAVVFWQQWHNGGVPLLLQAAASQFVLFRPHIVQLSAALAAASTDSMKQVVNCLQRMPTHGYAGEGSCDILDGLYQDVSHYVSSMSHGAGVRDMESDVELTVRLFDAILRTDVEWCWKHVHQIQPLTEHVYTVMRILSQSDQPCISLLASCLDYLTTVAQLHPAQVLKRLCEIEFLPSSGSTDDQYGYNRRSCLYGNVLTCHERLAASYPVTLAFLKLLHTLVELSDQLDNKGDIEACLVFCLSEILSVYDKWKYNNSRTHMHIAESCLSVVSRLLNNSEPSMSRAVSQCEQHLLFTDAGRSVFELINKGAVYMDLTIDSQLSAYEGLGRDVCNVVRLALAVLTRLLQQQGSVEGSSLVTLLTAQPASMSQPHPVYTIACYIYQRHDPRLPTLATLLLQLVAQNLTLSLLACFGTEAEVLREAYLYRLQAHMEDVHLKTVLVGLLNTCADSQPGLLDMFLDCQLDASTQKMKCTCLRTIVSLIDESRQGSHLCPAELLLTCLEFIHTLWRKRHLLARKYLLSNEHLWTAVCAPLSRNVVQPNTSSDDQNISVLVKEIKCAAFAMKILAQEIYECRTNLPEQLKAALTTLVGRGHLERWAQNISQWPLSGHVDVHIELVQAWRNLLLIVAHNKTLKLLSDDQKTSIVLCASRALYTLLHNDLLLGQAETAMLVKLAGNMATHVFMLIKFWQINVVQCEEVARCVVDVLEQACAVSDTVPAVVAAMLSAVLVLVQSAGQVKWRLDYLRILQASCCVIRDVSVLHRSPAVSVADALSTNRDLAIRVQTISIHLLNETLGGILQATSDTLTFVQWTSVLHGHLVLDKVLCSLLALLQSSQVTDTDYVMATLAFLNTIAQQQQGAEYLLSLGVLTYLRLPAHTGSSHLPAHKQDAYSTCSAALTVVSSIVTALGGALLADVLDFSMVHQQQLEECLAIDPQCSARQLRECAAACHLVCALSRHSLSVFKTAPQLFSSLMTCMARVLDGCVSQLTHPQHSQREKLTNQQAATVRRLSSQPHEDDASVLSVDVQLRLLDIMALCVTCWHHLSPDVCEALLYANVDTTRYFPLVRLSFNFPNADSMPSFGTLFSGIGTCISLCVKLSEPTSNNNQQLRLRAVYCLEHLLVISMAQAIVYLCDPHLPRNDKQLLKRELATELTSCYQSVSRLHHRTEPATASVTSRLSSDPRLSSPSKHSSSYSAFLNIISTFIGYLQ